MNWPRSRRSVHLGHLSDDRACLLASQWCRWCRHVGERIMEVALKIYHLEITDLGQLRPSPRVVENFWGRTVAGTLRRLESFLLPYGRGGLGLAGPPALEGWRVARLCRAARTGDMDQLCARSPGGVLRAGASGRRSSGNRDVRPAAAFRRARRGRRPVDSGFASGLD